MRSPHFSLAILLSTVVVLASAFSEGSAQQPTSEEDRPVKITTNLVQLDVQVLDRNGKPVEGLTAADFEVLQDGTPQQISTVTFVNERTARKVVIFRKQGTKDPKFVQPPPSNARSSQGRIITFVADDGNCLATLEGTATMRDALRRFIETQMLPDDRVAIYRTAGGASLLQAYTSNKEILRRLANKVSYMPSRGCGSTFEPLRDKSTIKVTGRGADSFESEADKAARGDREARERRNQVVGTIGVLSAVVDRLRNAPQRKTIFLLSEGIVADIKDDTFERLRDLADKAARSSVVIHTLGAKGVNVPGQISAQDEVLPGIIGGKDNVTIAVQERLAEERALNEGLAYLAAETGGRFVRNSNRLDVDVERVLESQSAYYLIAYEPSDETFRGKSFHKIEIRSPRPEFSVVSRRGFFGTADREETAVHTSADGLLYQAIASPFSETGLDVRLTLRYGTDARNESYLRTLLYVPADDLGLVADGDGKRTSFDVVAVVLDEKGKVATEFSRTYPIRVPKAGIATVEQNGLDFSSDLPIKNPGIYTVKVAIRNNNSKRLGSAGDVVEIPEKSRENILAGLITTTVKQNGQPSEIGERPMNAAFAPVFSQGTASIRRYKRGAVIAYAYQVLHTRGSAADLVRSAKLFRNGVEVAAFPDEKVDTANALPNGRIDDYGVFQVTDAIEAGDYVLQVTIREGRTNKASSQWVDFEVVN